MHFVVTFYLSTILSDFFPLVLRLFIVKMYRVVVLSFIIWKAEEKTLANKNLFSRNINLSIPSKDHNSTKIDIAALQIRYKSLREIYGLSRMAVSSTRDARIVSTRWIISDRNSVKKLSFATSGATCSTEDNVSTILAEESLRVVSRFIAMACEWRILYRSNSNGIYRRKSYDVSLPCGVSFIDTLLSLFTRASRFHFRYLRTCRSPASSF